MASRDIKEHNIGNGHLAFMCEFSIASAMDNLDVIKQLSHSSESRHRATYGKLLKNAAILHLVTARKGPYKTWRRSDITAGAI